ncbi:MAG: hypothetical protein ABIH66_03250 [bacterium]
MLAFFFDVFFGGDVFGFAFFSVLDEPCRDAVVFRPDLPSVPAVSGFVDFFFFFAVAIVVKGS